MRFSLLAAPTAAESPRPGRGRVSGKQLFFFSFFPRLIDHLGPGEPGPWQAQKKTPWTHRVRLPGGAVRHDIEPAGARGQPAMEQLRASLASIDAMRQEGLLSDAEAAELKARELELRSMRQNSKQELPRYRSTSARGRNLQ